MENVYDVYVKIVVNDSSTCVWVNKRRQAPVDDLVKNAQACALESQYTEWSMANNGDET